MFNGLKRDAKKVTPVLSRKGDVTYATGPCKIYIPKRWEDVGLASITDVVKFAGIYAIAYNGYYAIDTVPAIITSSPLSVDTVTVDDVDYYEFTYEKGSEVISNNKLVKNKLLLYSIDAEVIAKGKVPGYLSYEDTAKIFSRSYEFGDLKLGANLPILALVAMTIARSPKDGVTLYRQTVKSKNDMENNPPEYVALRNIGVTASNTTAKLLGSYFDRGLTSALINPSDKEENIEELLRSY